MIGGVEVFAKSVNIPAMTKRIPARPFVMWQKKDLKKANTLIVKHLKGKLK